MIVVMIIAKYTFGFEVTAYSVLWQIFACLFALACQQESYTNK